ncbi:5'-methylthioadenosine/S-adenosylhomocysteine nucleosidase [candidate division KSB3 bacterium]|uniref:5'-methylthioadenosine/S-adenosylhomocysteine nucleosidase n=1 Tax=candidate division KSB3 bacterium TaxID=2044937 RepID=A0A2G6KDR2_9BACT|nr:MAG: 5'-methylthioadenosine/S-adenosylhomocysteine nucleosidase [candidate division KSB3 bacterium]
MKIGIIAAMEEELQTLQSQLEHQQNAQFGQFHYYTGKLCRHDIALMLCGIGKVNAAIGATLLIDKFEPEAMINTGVAGGFPPDRLKIGDIVVSTDVRHHDADATAFNYEYGQIPRMPAAYQADERLRTLACRSLPDAGSVNVFEGQIMSGDSFIHHQKQITEIQDKFPSIMAVEMEGAAIAQTCYQFDVPFVIIRSISDLVLEDESHEMYQHSVTTAAGNSVKLVLNLLHKLQR